VSVLESRTYELLLVWYCQYYQRVWHVYSLLHLLGYLLIDDRYQAGMSSHVSYVSPSTR